MHRLALAAALAVFSFSAQAGYAVPPECKSLASGYPSVLTQSQARKAVKLLDKYPDWPGASACRAAVKRDWKL